MTDRPTEKYAGWLSAIGGRKVLALVLGLVCVIIIFGVGVAIEASTSMTDAAYFAVVSLVALFVGGNGATRIADAWGRGRRQEGERDA